MLKAHVRGHTRRVGDKSVMVRPHERQQKGRRPADDGWHVVQGTHLYVEGGKVARGPERLLGKPPSYLGSDAEIEERVADHEQARQGFLSFVQEQLEFALLDRQISKDQAERCRGYMEEITHHCGTFFLRQVTRNAEHIMWFRSCRDLTRAVDRMCGLEEDAQRITGGAWVTRLGRGFLMLDEGDDPKGYYLHELAHAVDFRSRFSGDPLWQKAWESEFLGEDAWPPSRYSQTSAKEGFAEYMRLVGTRAGVASEMYPLAWDAIQKMGVMW